MSAHTAVDFRLKRRETRVVRPFLDAEDYLYGAELRLNDEADFSTEELHVLEEDATEVIQPTLRIPAPPADLSARLSCNLDDLALLLVLEDGFIKNSRVVWQKPLVQLTDVTELELLPFTTPPVSWRSGISIHVVLSLAVNKPDEAGRATRKGSWFSRKSFTIGPAPRTPRFNVQYVDEQWFLERQMPHGTTYLVELDGDLDTTEENAEDLVNVYVAKTLATAMSRRENSGASAAFSHLLLVDVVSSALQQSLATLEKDPIPGGFLDRLTSRIAGGAGVQQSELISSGQKRQAGKVRAIVQSSLDLSQALTVASRK